MLCYKRTFFYSYGGYCPHLKYRVGKTYGQDTHELAQVSYFINCVQTHFSAMSSSEKLF